MPGPPCALAVRRRTPSPHARGLCLADLPARRPMREKDTSISARTLFPVFPIGDNPHARLGSVDPISVAYALRPRLRSRLTPGGRTCPGKPWDSGGGDFHPPFRYSCPHNRWRALHGGSRPRFGAARHAPLPTQLIEFRDFGAPLDSRSFSARDLSTGQLLRTV